MACQTAPRWLDRKDLRTAERPLVTPLSGSLRYALTLALGMSAAWALNFGIFAFLLNYVAGIGAPVAR